LVAYTLSQSAHSNIAVQVKVSLTVWVQNQKQE